MNILELISQLIGIKTLRLTQSKSKRGKNCIFHTQTTTIAQRVKKKNSSTASPIVGIVGSGEFK